VSDVVRIITAKFVAESDKHSFEKVAKGIEGIKDQLEKLGEHFGAGGSIGKVFGGLDKLTDTFNSIGAVGGPAIAVTATLGAAIAVVGAQIKLFWEASEHTMHYAHEMEKLSKQAGLEADEFQRLAFAGRFADMSAESMASSMGKLARKIHDARGEGKLLAGVNVGDNKHAKSTSQILTELSEKYQKLNRQDQPSFLKEAFVKGGAGMAELLSEGPKELREMLRTADELGLVMDKHTREQAKEWKKMKVIMGGVWEALMIDIGKTVVPEVLPLLREAAVWFKENKGEIAFMLKTLTKISLLSFKNLGNIFGVWYDILDNLWNKFMPENFWLTRAVNMALHPIRTAYYLLQDLVYFLSGKGSELGRQLAGYSKADYKAALNRGERFSITGEIAKHGEKPGIAGLGPKIREQIPEWVTNPGGVIAGLGPKIREQIPEWVTNPGGVARRGLADTVAGSGRAIGAGLGRIAGAITNHVSVIIHAGDALITNEGLANAVTAATLRQAQESNTQ
jgi:hypothetical protein